MKALQAIEGQLAWENTPRLSRQDRQVRIRVAAAGLNRADLLQRAGLYPPPPGASEVIGLECSGVVSEAGAGSRWQPGDRVCALLAGGGMAEEVVVDERHVLPVPQGVSLHEAAGLPEVYATAWLNLFQLAGLKPGERVLLHAGASGVGAAAIQLCRNLGNPCWVSVGSQERLDYCRSLGAEGGVLRGDGLEGLRGQAPFDVILDPVGGSYSAHNLDLLAVDGRWVLIGLMGGRKAELDLAKVLAKRIQLIGSALRSRSDDFKAGLLAQLQERVWPLFASGDLLPRVERYFSVAHAEEAFAALAGNGVNGKIVVRIDDSLI